MVTGATSTERVHVFIDYENVRKTARSRFLPVSSPAHSGMVDPVKTAQTLTNRRKRPSVLDSVSVFRGRPVPQHQPEASRYFDLYAAEWSLDRRCHLTQRPLKYYFPSQADPDYFEASEKGIDVALPMSVVEVTLAKQVDAIVIFSNDTDLFPAVEFAYDHGMHVEVAAWEGSRGLRFSPGSQRKMWCHFLNDSDFHAVHQDGWFSSS
ncbi:NYN domain protein [Corynebacterium glaucum]|uniref:NYN domain-containing protein n=1 Tax=Corynebacterium glaucum TaxID=187491 RepID=UPI0025B60152|nr:NYN domain-containing protein [Corynebacterium glaucum]WJZ08565.1 NYN domain protein [Corynebacterium glaucum]